MDGWKLYLHTYCLKNYRRLREARIELDNEFSIFVGSNNSGKTSATHAIQAFTAGSKGSFSLFDFSSSCWGEFDRLGEGMENGDEPPDLPSMSLDLWFEVAAADLYLVIPLLPSTAWEGTQVGIRIEFGARDPVGVLDRFRAARSLSLANAAALEPREGERYIPWPKSLTDYLKEELPREFELRYFVLDRARFDGMPVAAGDHVPSHLGNEPGGAALLKSLLKVDHLSAQRHLADPSTGIGPGAGRSEDLSRRLSRFYKRNLEQR